jgi:hypothetical protein
MREMSHTQRKYDDDKKKEKRLKSSLEAKWRKMWFLDASTHLYKRVCASVVGRSVVHLAFFLNRGNHVEIT